MCIRDSNYSVKGKIFDRSEVGRQKLAIGSVHIRSDITWSEEHISFAALHLGGHNIMSGALARMEQEKFDSMLTDIHGSFMKNDISEVVRLTDKYFENNSFSLRHLFKNEQRAIMSELLDRSAKDIDTSFRQLFESQYPVIQALSDLNMPLPDYFSTLMKFVLNRDIRSNLESDELDFEKLERNVEEIGRWPLEIDKETLGYLTSTKIDSLTSQWRDEPENRELLQTINRLMQTLEPLSLQYNLWKSQVRYFNTGRTNYPEIKDRAEAGDKYAQDWVEQFKLLGEHIRVRVE